jgi:hypothetical protein
MIGTIALDALASAIVNGVGFNVGGDPNGQGNRVIEPDKIATTTATPRINNQCSDEDLPLARGFRLREDRGRAVVMRPACTVNRAGRQRRR